ncbi:MAG TPA: hypothetical protein PLR06_03400, partial [Cyclobacteriaceae bacterium]|nr:hypothetical protein [Cyclobacteriaceae bacterium]
MAEGKDDLEKYLDDSLHEKDRHALEKRALDDTFLADAVDGAETIPHEDFSSDVGDLKKKIKGKPYRRIFTPLRIAAGVILLIGTSSLIYFLGFDQQENLAEESGFTSTLDTLSAAGKASDSALITMAKPESKTENKRELSQPGRVNNSFDKMKASEADSKSTTDIKKGEG